MKINDDGFILHGDIVFSKTPDELAVFEDAYAVCVNGVSQGVFKELPRDFTSLPLIETEGKLIMPGFYDLHTHAPQYQFRGNGMDMELLSWLNTYTFPEESKYGDPDYAEKAYGMFVKEMTGSATARACIFATAHKDAAIRLMEMFEESGLETFVGKVNMDRNVPGYYVETTKGSIGATRDWLDDVKRAGFKRTRPIITPRFTPSCTRELMKGLSALAKEYGVPVQSHLSENLTEIELVKELEPDVSCYADSYKKAGIIDKDIPCVMAHCVWSDETEISMLKENNVFIAHCPESNINLCSGVAPVRKYLELGMNIGLATDVAAGSSTSMFAAMRNAIYASKLRFRLFDEGLSPLSFSEAFYLASKGGGAFFGKAGSLEKGYMFDALIIDDGMIPTAREDLTVEERAERVIYLCDDRHIKGKYVSGRKVI
ncbi:MAG: amidohydrolase family protein [Lachnospiraceae bacterium]|nr:amidohydrolase family protein [Lachnospiraceae bacterium]